MYAATRNLGGCVLTERRIRDAKPDSKTRFLWDAQVRTVPMDALALVRDAFHGEWNYKLLPR